VAHDEARLFPALLRHWRTRRGQSQLDLSIAAEVSARHVSFLETARARPSREMVLRLAAVLDVPLRDQNALLHAAGFPSEFAEPRLADGMPPGIEQAIARMLAQHEPYPMYVLDRSYGILRTNQGALRLLATLVADPSALTFPMNLFQLLFDPRLARGAVVDWERTARALLSRLHRESLTRAGDVELADLVRSLESYPDVPPSVRHPDFSTPSEATLVLRLRTAEHEFAFLTMITMFNAPQNITLDELRIESLFPLDDVTAAACQRLSLP
jgi:transcriptional regulator with XRE-family HTH domain